MAVPALAVAGGDALRKDPYPAWPALQGNDIERVRRVLETTRLGWQQSAGR